MGLKAKIALCVTAAALGIAGLSSMYTLSETDQAVISFQGNVTRVYIGSFDAGQVDHERMQQVREWADQNGYENVDVYSTHGFMGSGLHFKIPFLENVITLSDRLLDYGADPELTQTKDKRQLMLDYYTKWYIENPLDFYLNVGNERAGNARIDDKVYSVVRNEVTVNNFNETIRTTNREVRTLDGVVELNPIENGRNIIRENIIDGTNDLLNQYGMHIRDQRFIRVELPEQNQNAVCDRMIEERRRIGALYLAEGQAENIRITADADATAAETVADAQQAAGKLIGQGEKQAAEIYSNAYYQDPEFFEFWLTQKAYREAFSEDGATVIMSTDTDFNQLLDGISTAEDLYGVAIDRAEAAE